MALPDELFPGGLEPLLSAMAQRFAAEWAEREVEVLTSARASLLPLRTDARRGELLCLSLQAPPRLYQRLARGGTEALERNLLSCARGLLPRALSDKLEAVTIGPLLSAERDWREQLRERREQRSAPRRAAPAPHRRPPLPPPPSVEIEVRPEARLAPVEERAPKELRHLEEELKEKKVARSLRYKQFRIP
jgi:hypothetical protein